jgi:aldose 1-epimerase
VLDDRSLPTGSTAVEDTEWDLRSTGSGPQPLGALRLDTAYTDLDRTDGIATVAVGRADGSVVEVWQDTAFGFVQVYTADAFDGSADALAVEPMTCAPDAFNNRAGLVVLQPDEVWSGSWGVRTR